MVYAIKGLINSLKRPRILLPCTIHLSSNIIRADDLRYLLSCRYQIPIQNALQEGKDNPGSRWGEYAGTAPDTARGFNAIDRRSRCDAQQNHLSPEGGRACVEVTLLKAASL